MRKKIYYFISVFLIILIPTILTEIYLKYVGLGDPIIYDSNFVYGYAPRANQKKDRLKNSTVTINDVGLRAIYNWKENNDKKKIIFFGDSVTYGGSYIDDKETFAHLACENIKNTNYICGNAGVNAYGIFNIVYRSKYDLRLTDADLRIFLLIPDDFYRGLQDSNTAHFYMKENNFIFPAIFEAINFISTKYNLRKYLSKNSDSRVENNQYSLITESVEILNSEIKRLIDADKKVLIFYSNTKSNISLNKSILKKINNKINFEIIDLSHILTEEMYEDGTHYNKLGHKSVANFISKKIDEIIQTN